MTTASAAMSSATHGKATFTGWLGLISTLDALVRPRGRVRGARTTHRTHRRRHRSEHPRDRRATCAGCEIACSGAILAAGEPGWDDGPSGLQPRRSSRRPALIALPARRATTSSRSSSFAREHGLQVAPQRTGHNAEPLGVARRRDPAQDRRACRASRSTPSGASRASRAGVEVGGRRAARLRARPRGAARLDARTSASSATRSAAASAGTRASTACPPTASWRSSS